MSLCQEGLFILTNWSTSRVFLYHETDFISHPRANKMWNIFPVTPRDQTCFHEKQWGEITQWALLNDWTIQVTVFQHKNRVIGLRQTQRWTDTLKKKKSLKKGLKDPIHSLFTGLAVSSGKIKMSEIKTAGLGGLCNDILTHTPSPTNMNL